MVKRILSGFLSLCMILALLPTAALAAEESVLDVDPLGQIETENNSAGKNDSNDLAGEVETTAVTYPVTGGNIHFDPATGSITACDEGVTELQVPSEINGVAVTSIGDSAFSDCRSLVKVTLPDCITNIGYMAFNGCSELKDVYYAGSEAQWEQIKIGDSNDLLDTATIHCHGTEQDRIGTDEGGNTDDTAKAETTAYPTTGGNTYSDLTGEAIIDCGEDITTSFSNGNGTESDPFQIVTAQQLNEVRNNLSSHFVLAKDIDLSIFSSEGWSPIGTKEKPFTGTLDGAGHTIKNIHLLEGDDTAPAEGVLDGSKTWIGLFGYAINASIQNVNLEIASCNAKGASRIYLGGLVGYDISSYINNVRVSGTDLIASPGTGGWAYHNSVVGGIVGYADGTQITNAHNYCNIFSKGSLYDFYAGGITGYGGIIVWASNSGNITSEGSNCDGYIGGISGYNADISECYNTGSLYIPNGSSYHDRNAGGIAGYGGSVENCYNLGDISSLDVAAGIAGENTTIKNCYSIGGINDEIYYYISSKGEVSAHDMAIQSNFTGFDFETIWMMPSNTSYNYPILRNNVPESDDSDNETDDDTDSGFQFITNEPTNCIKVGDLLEIYVDYYHNGQLDTSVKDFISVVNNVEIIDVVPREWNDTSGQRYLVTAKEPGETSITVTNPQNGDAMAVEIFVVEDETGYSFDGVPKMTIEDGKVTNFYNYSGLVVDNFNAVPNENSNGIVESYTVTMDIYNTKAVYAAVSAYNAQGLLTGFQVIDRHEMLPDDFTDTLKKLSDQWKDLFLLWKNPKAYSGESISTWTPIEIEVPAGGHLSISNNPSSCAVVLLSNLMGLGVDLALTASDIALDSKGVIKEMDTTIIEKSIEDILMDSLTGHAYETQLNIIRECAASELSTANWNYDDFGELLEAYLNHLSESGINIFKVVAENMTSLSGIASAGEAIAFEIIPTGQLINLLYGWANMLEAQASLYLLVKSADAPRGIYIYAPPIGKAYYSNGISVEPSQTQDEVVVHAYHVIDTDAIGINESSFSQIESLPINTFETYSITMYKNGKEIQPDSLVTVKIPLSDKFKAVDSNQIKVYRHNGDGSLTDMNAVVLDDYIIFFTDHFSYYSVIDVQNIAVSGVTLSELSLTFCTQDETKILTAVITPENATNKNVTWSSDNTTVATVDENGVVTAVAAGTATITVTTEDGRHSATCTVSVQTTVTPSTEYTITFDPNGGTLSGPKTATTVNGKLTALPSVIRANHTFNGWYTVANGGTRVTTDTVFDADVTVYAQWSKIDSSSESSSGGTSTGGGSSSANYSIIVPTEVENGSITVRPTRADRGDTVTIAAIPNPGYEVDEIIVADRNGHEIPVRDIGSNRYTFKMPSGQVKVDAVFVKIEEATPQIIFRDVTPGTYYYDAVQWAVEQGITTGVTATTFNPNSGCTRAQIVTFLWRANGSPAPQTAMNPFTDISPDAYYYDAVLWAVEQGITSGTTATSFTPNKACTRAQAVTFLWRSEESPAADNSSFNDVPDSTYYADAVDWAVANDVTHGITTGTFGPSNTCTRAQIVTFLYRTMA